jgi:hypothetical protein
MNMPLVFYVYGSVDSLPTLDEVIETIAEAEFDIEVETEDDDEDAEWQELEIFEDSIDGAIKVSRMLDKEDLGENLQVAIESLEEDGSAEANKLAAILGECSLGFTVELADDLAEDDNALVLGKALANYLAERCDGVYSLDGDAWFDNTGELILEFITEE